jgi:hypothetical protein
MAKLAMAASNSIAQGIDIVMQSAAIQEFIKICR